jgi:ADP-heptose:LPS heptosyltransferase
MIHRSHPMDSRPPPLRVVIPIVAGVGNALMAMPMARRLKAARPEAQITVIARIDAMAEPFRRMPEVKEVRVSGNGMGGQLRMVLWARQCRADVYLVPFPSNRWQYNLMALLSGAKRSIMHAFPIGRWRALGVLPATRVPAERGLHDVAQNLRLMAALKIDTTPEAPIFNVTNDDRMRADRLLDAAGIAQDAPFFTIHAGSGQTILGRAKRWPTEKYAVLINRIKRDWATAVVLMEGPDEAGVGREILQACGEDCGDVSVLSLTGPLGDAAAVLKRSRLYIGSDSGLAHLAAAVGTRAVTIFAPADPDRVCPFGNRDLVVRPNKSCSPCFHYPWKTPYPKMLCREPYCVREVDVEAVLEAVGRGLEAGIDRRLKVIG